MDREQAAHALSDAGAAGSRLRAKARLHAAVSFVLGLAAVAILLVFGVLVPPPASYAIMGVGLLPLIALGIYTGSRPVVPRHYAALYQICGAAGAGIYSVVVVVGAAVFPGSLAWWLPGALLTAVPFFAVGYLDLKAARGRP
ncbi:hypothetical protein [Nonomuraea turcica]|uniref:hypothetical protein n=1 Tax=Nonomuraea sp. G32 TaxID=3067274 RepID=UPI00273C3933|nr:hypothetical protein [Nonomuraea sp. G32]MDP4502366.1 hypothetical protein [Nonomuraea sp. G32]